MTKVMSALFAQEQSVGLIGHSGAYCIVCSPNWGVHRPLAGETEPVDRMDDGRRHNLVAVGYPACEKGKKPGTHVWLRQKKRSKAWATRPLGDAG